MAMATPQNDHELPADLLKAIHQLETELLKALAVAEKPLEQGRNFNDTRTHQATPHSSR